MKKITTLALANLMVALAPLCAHAEEAYPSHPITIVVPTAPGGGNDAMARILAQQLATAFGQSVVVENKPGANGAIAANYVARASADGYTLMFGYIGTHAITPALQQVSYDPVKDFAPIGQVAESPTMLVVSTKIPAKTVQELVAYAKQPDARVNYASAGTGTAPDMAGILFSQATGAPMVGIPYKGSAPAMLDTVAGVTQLMFPSLFTAVPQIRANQVRPLAMASAQRSKLFPDLPTLKEQGIDVTMTQWYGVFAPSGTPPAAVAKLNTAMNKALNDPAVVKKISEQGADVVTSTPEQFGALVSSELARWTRIRKENPQIGGQKS
jgi:tripartite-type tricarboxylate transporter receptor subunit TctC